MKRRIKGMLASSAGLVSLLAIIYIKEGSIPWPFLAIVAGFLALFLGFAAFEEARDRRHEKAVLARLASLGGGATLSELEASLFDAATGFAEVQRHRDAIARLREDGRIVETDDRLHPKR